jgi:hypothetical protein
MSRTLCSEVRAFVIQAKMNITGKTHQQETVLFCAVRYSHCNQFRYKATSLYHYSITDFVERNLPNFSFLASFLEVLHLIL